MGFSPFNENNIISPGFSQNLEGERVIKNQTWKPSRPGLSLAKRNLDPQKLELGRYKGRVRGTL